MIRAAAAVVASALAAAALTLAADAAGPKRANTAVGVALSKGLVAKLSDLPAGWKSSRSGGGAGTVTCKSFSPNQSDLTTIGDTEATFESGDGLGTVVSRAAIFKTAAQAQTSWGRLVRPALLPCLASSIEGIANKTTTVKIVSKGALPLSVPGSRHAGYRVVANVTLSGQTFKAYLDAILQGSGQADTAILVTSVGQAPAKALEAKLASAVAGRLPK